MCTQSLNSAHVADARKPASAIAWRSESSQWGSNARRRESAQPMHASTSSAATTTATIAAVESVSLCFAGARVTACTVRVDCAGVAAVTPVGGTDAAPGVTGVAGVVVAVAGAVVVEDAVGSGD
jgi:hypothetical protein